MTRVRKNLHRFALRPVSLLAVALVAVPTFVMSAGRARNPAAYGPDRPLERVSLSELMRENYSGLSFEEGVARDRLLDQAHEYLEFRGGELTEDEEEDVKASCRVTLDAEATNPYCPMILAMDEKERKDSKVSRERRKRRARVVMFQAAFRRGDVETLKGGNESELSAALKHIKNVRLLKGLVTKILTPSDCLVPSSLSMALGLRMEREFPKDDFKKLAADLYSRSAQCGKDPAAIQASYRLGLIRIWEGKCEDAETILSKIVDTPETTDYRMRVAYWRYHCAGEMKNDRLRAQMREWLLREYPLSLHGLLASTEAPTTQQTEIPFLNDHEVEVSFRSKNRAKLNSSVRAIEALQLLEAHPAALEILTPLVDQLAGTEVSFQLYTAVLLLRSGDSIHRFQLMGSLFRENPFLLSRSTITLLYPLQKMSLLQGQTQKLDPYLIISLIRQESAFNDRAKSPAGALGLMQLQPSTARRFERVSKKQLLDPKTNIRVGVKYFTRLLRQYDNDVELALAAYNAGPQNVAEWQKRYPISNRLLFIDLMPLRETRDYVSSIARNYYWYQRLYRSGGPAEVEETPKSSGGFSVFRGLAGK